MSTTTTAASSSSTCSLSYQLPVQDVACAVNKHKNYTDVLKDCCKPANVESYNDGCNYYCLVQGQSVRELNHCLQDGGVDAGDVYCNSKNATKTQPLPSSATNTGTSTETGTSTSSGSGSSETSEGAAVAVHQPVSKGGLGLLAMMVCSGLMGVLA